MTGPGRHKGHYQELCKGAQHQYTIGIKTRAWYIGTVLTVSGEEIRSSQLWETVLVRVREAILAGEVPAGTKLVETELAERFGTSRGPIRQAIRELAREGLVVELPRRRAFVATLTARDLVEVYAVREALESGAMREVVAHASDAEISALGSSLADLEDGWARGVDYLESAILDLQFHRQLVALRRNARMAAMYEQMLAQTMLLLRSAAEGSPTLRSGMPRSVHRDILDALQARSPERAGAAIARHYRHAEDRLFGRLGGVNNSAEVLPLPGPPCAC